MFKSFHKTAPNKQPATIGYRESLIATNPNWNSNYFRYRFFIWLALLPGTDAIRDDRRAAVGN
jgi:hypothetical protein